MVQQIITDNGYKEYIMELWDLYDKNRIKTGNVKKRGDTLIKDEFHLVIHICLFNSAGQMLIQQRQPFKEEWPNMWDLSVGGSALKGECSHIAAERELFEEIGYLVDLSKERPFFTINFDGGFDDFYLLFENINIQSLKLQKEEVLDVKWAAENEILDLIHKEKFIPYHSNLISMIFEMRGNRGAIRTDSHI
jgi:isopentenyldiphosphate isomerase